VIFGRITERGIAHWADPHHQQPGEINTNDGGRGVYFEDPDGHNLEILTRSYGSGPA
jgi:catechol 2,3-dioxygenase-like lactoylglutathione lyase family enzyme